MNGPVIRYADSKLFVAHTHTYYRIVVRFSPWTPLILTFLPQANVLTTPSFQEWPPTLILETSLPTLVSWEDLCNHRAMCRCGRLVCTIKMKSFSTKYMMWYNISQECHESASMLHKMAVPRVYNCELLFSLLYSHGVKIVHFDLHNMHHVLIHLESYLLINAKT